MTKKPEQLKVKVVDPLDKEMVALEAVWRALDSVQPEARSRVLGFIKSKFIAEWPRGDY